MPKGIMTVLMLLISCFKTAWFSSPEPVSAREEITYVSYSYYASFDEQKEFPATMGRELTLDLETGATLEIEGWDKELVSVKVQKNGRDAKDCEINYEESASGLVISSRFVGDRRNYSSDLDLQIMVPHRFDLEIDSMGGEVTISNVEGKIAGKTMGGELTLVELKGDIRLTTMGGDISLSNSTVDGEMKTMGGDVRLQDVMGTVQGSTMSGDVIYKNVKRNPSTPAEQQVKVKSMGGDINVDEAPFGADVSTMGGDVHVHSAVQYVKAETMGGDIDIDEADGWIKAKTMGGDVTAVVVGDPAQGKHDVDITSYSGDITLTVPDGLSMNFDIELAYTRNRSGDYKIISDFDMKQEESQEWDVEDGTPRRYIRGTGNVGTGANKVRIRTINGDITIRKSGK
jgi:DUF4097 and DUF4098 domain-containing protein YvlB